MGDTFTPKQERVFLRSIDERTRRGRLRDYVRYHIAQLLDRRALCWADIATWEKGMTPLREIQPGEGCRKESETCKGRACYCGKYREGTRYRGEKKEQKNAPF